MTLGLKKRRDGRIGLDRSRDERDRPGGLGGFLVERGKGSEAKEVEPGRRQHHLELGPKEVAYRVLLAYLSLDPTLLDAPQVVAHQAKVVKRIQLAHGDTDQL